MQPQIDGKRLEGEKKEIKAYTAMTYMTYSIQQNCCYTNQTASSPGLPAHK